MFYNKKVKKMTFKRMLRRNIEHFVKKPILEKLAIPEMK